MHPLLDESKSEKKPETLQAKPPTAMKEIIFVSLAPNVSQGEHDRSLNKQQLKDFLTETHGVDFAKSGTGKRFESALVKLLKGGSVVQEEDVYKLG